MAYDNFFTPTGQESLSDIPSEDIFLDPEDVYLASNTSSPRNEVLLQHSDQYDNDSILLAVAGGLDMPLTTFARTYKPEDGPDQRQLIIFDVNPYACLHAQYRLNLISESTSPFHYIKKYFPLIKIQRLTDAAQYLLNFHSEESVWRSFVKSLFELDSRRITLDRLSIGMRKLKRASQIGGFDPTIYCNLENIYKKSDFLSNPGKEMKSVVKGYLGREITMIIDDVRFAEQKSWLWLKHFQVIQNAINEGRVKVIRSSVERLFSDPYVKNILDRKKHSSVGMILDNVGQYMKRNSILDLQSNLIANSPKGRGFLSYSSFNDYEDWEEIRMCNLGGISENIDHISMRMWQVRPIDEES